MRKRRVARASCTHDGSDMASANRQHFIRFRQSYFFLSICDISDLFRIQNQYVYPIVPRPRRGVRAFAARGARALGPQSLRRAGAETVPVLSRSTRKSSPSSGPTSRRPRRP